MRMRNNMKYENRRGGHGMRTLDKVRNRGGGGHSGRVKRSNEYSGLVAGKEKKRPNGVFQGNKQPLEM